MRGIFVSEHSRELALILQALEGPAGVRNREWGNHESLGNYPNVRVTRIRLFSPLAIFVVVTNLNAPQPLVVPTMCRRLVGHLIAKFCFTLPRRHVLGFCVHSLSLKRKWVSTMESGHTFVR